MNSRERTLMALRHETPDRPPVSATYTPEVAKLLRSVYGHPEEDLGYVMGNDLIKTTVGIELSYHLTEDPVYTCPFGITFRNVKNSAGAYTEIIDGPLRDDPDGEKLAAYRLPDPDDDKWYAPVKRAVKRYGREKFIIGSWECCCKVNTFAPLMDTKKEAPPPTHSMPAAGKKTSSADPIPAKLYS